MKCGMRCELSRWHGQLRRAGLRALWWQFTNTAERGGGEWVAKGVLPDQTGYFKALAHLQTPTSVKSTFQRQRGVVIGIYEQTATRMSVTPGDGVSRFRIQPSTLG